jgi:hypothetical protein
MHPPRALTLQFRPRLDDAAGRKELRDGLSAVLQVGGTLWVANDESCTVERLSLDGEHARHHLQFALDDLLKLPAPGRGPDAAEVDIEGMDTAEGWLWVVGSHSRKRCKIDPQEPARRCLKRLARTEAEANRHLLARIPVVERDGAPALARRDGPLRAQQLRGGAHGNALTRLLRKDRHLGPFLDVPGKENGVDIEGLAVAGERVFLGLRGPVLRGWAVVLELRPQGHGARLRLAPVGEGKSRVRKHLLDLGGLGIRDLCRHGDDLLVLAGPTMALDGPVRVLRWRHALQADQACVLSASALETVLEVPFGRGEDHAEGIALFRRAPDAAPELLVVYDSPAARRQVGASALQVDLFPLPSRD